MPGGGRTGDLLLAAPSLLLLEKVKIQVVLLPTYTSDCFK